MLTVHCHFLCILSFAQIRMQVNNEPTFTISVVASSIIMGGGAYIHIFVFRDDKNNRFRKTYISVSPPKLVFPVSVCCIFFIMENITYFNL